MKIINSGILNEEISKDKAKEKTYSIRKAPSRPRPIDTGPSPLF